MASAADQLDKKRRHAVGLCIGVTLVVACVQLLVGWRFRLISITAEGLHTAADHLDSLVAFVFVIVASRPADLSHPFSHGKYDSLAALVEGAFVAATACWALFKASSVLLGFAEPDPQPTLLAMGAMLLAGGVYMLVSAKVLRIAEEVGSPAVRAEALHLRTHVYITIGLCAGLGLTRVGQARQWPDADRLEAMAAMVLGLFLLTVAYRIVLPGYRQLVDTALPDDELQQVVGCLEDVRRQFVEVHAIRTRSAGTDRHVDFHLVVPPEMTIEAAHRLSHEIEQRMRERLPGTRLLVHVEPASPTSMRRYLERDRTGLLVLGRESPIETESEHHEDPRAHQV